MTVKKKTVTLLQQHAKAHNFSIQVAGLGRAHLGDVPMLIETGIDQFHLHAHIRPQDDKARQERSLTRIREAVTALRSCNPRAVISMAMLDIGSIPGTFLEYYGDFLINTLAIDILSVPDTSGQTAPNTFHNIVKFLVNKTADTPTVISVHCHNDLGMATANTVMGVVAGAGMVEVSALGIGERNGIGDLFSVGKTLKEQKYTMNLRIEDVPLFREYYRFVSDICSRQTGEALLGYNTPVFRRGRQYARGRNPCRHRLWHGPDGNLFT